MKRKKGKKKEKKKKAKNEEQHATTVSRRKNPSMRGSDLDHSSPGADQTSPDPTKNGSKKRERKKKKMTRLGVLSKVLPVATTFEELAFLVNQKHHVAASLCSLGAMGPNVCCHIPPLPLFES
jgi:hypothetical protein